MRNTSFIVLALVRCEIKMHCDDEASGCGKGSKDFGSRDAVSLELWKVEAVEQKSGRAVGCMYNMAIKY